MTARLRLLAQFFVMLIVILVPTTAVQAAALKAMPVEPAITIFVPIVSSGNFGAPLVKGRDLIESTDGPLSEGMGKPSGMTGTTALGQGPQISIAAQLPESARQ